MKKALLFVIILVLMGMPLFAGIEVTSSTAQQLDVKTTIPDIEFIEAKYQDGNMYSKLIVPQAGQVEVGNPDVPAFASWILIPNGTTVDISTNPGHSLVYENIDLPPVQPSPSDSKDAPLPPFTKDETVYSTNNNYPGIFAETEPIKHKRGQECTILWIYPYQYNPVERTLTVYPDLQISVNFSGVIQPIPANLVNDRLIESLKGFGINAEAVLQAEESVDNAESSKLQRTAGCELLIITDPTFSTAANTLADWKTKRGIFTKVVTTTTTGTSIASIESYIDNTVSWTPVPSYFLFIGDAEDIPPQYVGGTPTDFYYADLANPPDYVADFGYGRLSVDTASQADSLVARIIRYERTPSTNSDYYEDILNAACFQDGEWLTVGYESPDQIANRRFCKTSEDVRNYLHDIQSYPWSQREYVAYNRVGSAEIFPRWWNDYTQAGTYIFENDNPPNGGVEIPASMQKPTFPWDGNTADISSAFNNGVFFALFRAHGSSSGWSDPDFYSANVDALANGEDRPIVWSITCQSGHFDGTECFAEHWIRHSTGGSCGVLAATRDSYSGKNDRLIWGMMNAIWPTFDTYCSFSYGGSTPIYRMGDVKNYGMDYMSTHYSVANRQETIRLFHWFGDPTMEMWTSEPSQLTDAYATTPVGIGTSSMTVKVEPAVSGMLVCAYTDNADEIFATATTNASGYAYLTFNNPLSVEPLVQVTVTKHNYLPFEFNAGPNIWNGSYNRYWSQWRNWSLGHVPLASEDVIIPAVGYCDPMSIDFEDAECNDLTIESGVELQVKDQTLTVNGDLNVSGHINMLETNATITVLGDVDWESGSNMTTTVNGVYFHVYGDWDFSSGANVNPTQGYIDFRGTSDSWIRSYSTNSSFYRLRNYKSGGGRVIFSNLSTEDLIVNGLVYTSSTSDLVSMSSHNFIMRGDFNYYGTFDFTELSNTGSVIFDGTSQSINNYSSGSGIFNNVIFSASTSATLSGVGITVAGDLTIEQGVFNPNNYTVNVGGDWTNSVGSAGFTEGAGRVIFDGPSHQYVNSDETFNILEVDCGAALRVNNVNHTVTCNSYDWTSGGIDILSGTFTANELEDNGIYGGYWVNPGGEINLLQDSGHWIDLNGSIWMSGGTMNIYGGQGESYWPFAHDASITMSGGVLDIKEQSIRIHNSGTYTLTEDITGGTIRTPLSFSIDRTDFNPAGGTIELYSSVDANVFMVAGSNLPGLKINKTVPSKNGNDRSKDKDFVILKDRDGTTTRYEKSNTITSLSELDINGDFTIDAGIFDPNDSTMYVAGEWTNNVGDAGFVEGNGRVVLDKSTAGVQFIQTDEHFNILENANAIDGIRIDVGTDVVCNMYVWTSGNLSASYSIFTAFDLADDGLFGEIYALSNSEIYLYQDPLQYVDLFCTDIVVRDGALLKIIGGADESFWCTTNPLDIEIDPGGVLDFDGHGIDIYNTSVLTEDIEGTIRTSGWFTCRRSDFTPTAGTVELYGQNDAYLSISSGSEFYNLEIDKQTPTYEKSTAGKDQQYDALISRDGTIARYSKSNTVLLASDCVVDSVLTLTNGALTLNGHELTVANDMYVYGTLNMTNAADTLNVGTDYHDRLWFESGSIGNLSHGVANIYGWFQPLAGCSVTCSTDNTVIFKGVAGGGPNNQEPTTTYGNIEIHKDPNNRTYVSGQATEPIVVNGDFIIHPDNEFELQYSTVIIHGTMTDQTTSEIYVYDEPTKYFDNSDPADNNSSKNDSGAKGGSLEIDTEFTLNGLMDVGDGDVLLHGLFELASTGTLTIDGGSFISDAAHAKDRAWQYMNGTLNLSSGLFEITNNSIYLQSSFNDNITGGTIRCGYTFFANDPGVFEPLNNTLEFAGGGNPYIQCGNGNFFNNLIINRTTTTVLYTDITITDNLEIVSGRLDSYFGSQHDIYVGGNWTNNVGDAGFGEGTGTVEFIGNGYSDILTDEKFYNLSINKTNLDWESTEIMDSVTINVLNDLQIQNGTLEMNENSTLNIDNDLTIAYEAGLNASGVELNLQINLGGDFTNNNTYSDSWYGFWSGTSTFTFDGSGDQLVMSSCVADTFYNVVVDKSAGEFRPTNDTEIFGDLDILNGAWDDNITGLNHNLYGDVYVAAIGDWYGSGCTVTFKGTIDQTYEFLANSYLSNVTIDKSPADVKAKDNPEGEEYVCRETKGAKTQTVTLLSNMLNQGGASLIIEEGILDLNGHYAGSYGGDIIINDGGKIEVDEDATLKVGDGSSLIVNSGGILETIGSLSHEAKVTRFTTYDYYDLNVYSGGTISAEYAVFENTGFNGVFVDNGGIVDASHPFNYCTFQHGLPTPGSAFLVINNDQDLTITGAHFPDDASANFNVAKDDNQGTVLMNNATGVFAGEDYEYDPYGLVTWIPSVLPPIDDLTITYTPAAKGSIELSWTYSTTVDSFYIYRDTDPYFTLGTPHATIPGTTTTWSEPATGAKYFYIVTAFNNDVPVATSNTNRSRNELRNITR